MSYLVCEECGGYYELQLGESADDFDTCICGGKLSLSNDDDYYIVSEHVSVPRKNRINWLGVAIGSLFFFIIAFSVIIMGLVLSFDEINVILISLSIISGFLSSFMSKTSDYNDGLINGFLVGFIWGFILILIVGFYPVYVMIMIFAAFGGALGVFLRKKLDS